MLAGLALGSLAWSTRFCRTDTTCGFCSRLASPALSVWACICAVSRIMRAAWALLLPAPAEEREWESTGAAVAAGAAPTAKAGAGAAGAEVGGEVEEDRVEEPPPPELRLWIWSWMMLWRFWATAKRKNDTHRSIQFVVLKACLSNSQLGFCCASFCS